MSEFWEETLIPTIVLAFIMCGVGFLIGWRVFSEPEATAQCEALITAWVGRAAA